MRFAFQFVPFRFALLSCAIYLVLIGVLAVAAALIASAASKDWAVSGPRWFWLALNAGVFLAGSAVAWRVLYTRHGG